MKCALRKRDILRSIIHSINIWAYGSNIFIIPISFIRQLTIFVIFAVSDGDAWIQSTSPSGYKID